MPDNKMSEKVPEQSRAALLIIDVITDFAFEDGEKLLVQAKPIARKLAALKKEAKTARIPAIYINDNFGKWQEDFKTTLKHSLRSASKGKNFVKLLKPGKDDYYILKPQRSAFYTTALELLLENLGVKTLILTGFTTDICILFSANDAYMRDYELFIPRNCTCAVTPEDHQNAIEFIERVLKADTRPSGEIDLKKLNSTGKKTERKRAGKWEK